MGVILFNESRYSVSSEGFGQVSVLLPCVDYY